jgi:hypothetical protein
MYVRFLSLCPIHTQISHNAIVPGTTPIHFRYIFFRGVKSQARRSHSIALCLVLSLRLEVALCWQGGRVECLCDLCLHYDSFYFE